MISIDPLFDPRNRVRFREPKIDQIPQFGSILYTIWNDTDDFVYVGIGGIRGATAEDRNPRSRIMQHWQGMRSGDQFCIYVQDHFVLPQLVNKPYTAQNGQIDRLVRQYIQDHQPYGYKSSNLLEAASMKFVLALITGSLWLSPQANANVLTSVAKEAAEAAGRGAAAKAAVQSAKNAKEKGYFPDGQQVDTEQFLARAYTKNYTKSVVMSLQGFTLDAGIKKTFKIEIVDEVGRREERGNKFWIAVPQKSKAKVGNEEVVIPSKTYYDIKSGLLGLVVFESDGNTNSYEWLNFPTRIKIGEKIQAAKITEKDGKGNVLASGTVEISASAVEDKLEYCHIESTVSNDKEKTRTVTSECYKFKPTDVPVAARIEIQVNGKTDSLVEGPVSIRD